MIKIRPSEEVWKSLDTSINSNKIKKLRFFIFMYNRYPIYFNSGDFSFCLKSCLLFYILNDVLACYGKPHFLNFRNFF